MRWVLLLILLLSACVPAVSETYLRWAERSWQYQDPGRLGIGDSFAIKVFGQNDLSGEFVVNELGVVRFPLVGTLTAQGRTCSELEDDISARLGQSFVKDPLVACSVVAIRSRRVSVVGQVVSPGNVPYTLGLTVLDAIAAAKGIDTVSAAGDVFVTRTVDGEQIKLEVPIQEIMKGRAPNLVLWPGDVIYVPAFHLLN